MLVDRVCNAYEHALEKNAAAEMGVLEGAKATGSAALKALRGHVVRAGESVAGHGAGMVAEHAATPLGKATVGQTLKHTVGRGVEAYGGALRDHPGIAGGITAGAGALGLGAATSGGRRQPQY